MPLYNVKTVDGRETLVRTDEMVGMLERSLQGSQHGMADIALVGEDGTVLFGNHLVWAEKVED